MAETLTKRENQPDLRQVGLHPDFWFPLAQSSDLKVGKLLKVSFAGTPIVLARTDSGSIFALEDRCAHRQVPLSAGVLCGEALKCGYHGWTYDSAGKCVTVPGIGKEKGLPNGVQSFPCREAYGLIFVFPGDPDKVRTVDFPNGLAAGNPAYKTRTLSRRIRCHYSFMHENLMDMNHQFLHRSLMGSIQPVLLRMKKEGNWIEAVYKFDRVSGSQSLGEKFMIGEKAKDTSVHEHDVMVIRTQYPYQTLTFCRADRSQPNLDLWLAYVPIDKEQKFNHSYGLMSIKKPRVPGLINIFWPFICWFTNGIFAQDKWIVEQEQRAYDEQGGDHNQEIFPLIRGLRDVLMKNGVQIPQ